MTFPFDAAVYDQIARRSDDLPFWAEVVEQGTGPVLELGIGTGRLALPLAPLASEYHGIDVEPSMLEVLSGKLRDSRIQVKLHQGSFLELDLGMQYALVFIPANTISHVISEDDSRQFFSGVRQHTARGGRFVIDTFNPGNQAASGERRVFARYQDVTDGEEVVVNTTPVYDHANQVVTHALDYWKHGERIRKAELRQRIYYPAELAAWLRCAGFDNIRTYGAYDRSPLAWDSDRLIVVATARDAT